MKAPNHSANTPYANFPHVFCVWNIIASHFLNRTGYPRSLQSIRPNYDNNLRSPSRITLLPCCKKITNWLFERLIHCLCVGPGHLKLWILNSDLALRPTSLLSQMKEQGENFIGHVWMRDGKLIVITDQAAVMVFESHTPKSKSVGEQSGTYFPC